MPNSHSPVRINSSSYFLVLCLGYETILKKKYILCICSNLNFWGCRFCLKPHIPTNRNQKYTCYQKQNIPLPVQQIGLLQENYIHKQISQTCQTSNRAMNSLNSQRYNINNHYHKNCKIIIKIYIFIEATQEMQ